MTEARGAVAAMMECAVVTGEIFFFFFFFFFMSICPPPASTTPFVQVSSHHPLHTRMRGIACGAIETALAPCVRTRFCRASATLDAARLRVQPDSSAHHSYSALFSPSARICAMVKCNLLEVRVR